MSSAAARGQLHRPHRSQHRGRAARFIKDKCDAFLDCGILAHDFLKLRCGECRNDKLLVFSFKRCGLCPSCADGDRVASSVYIPVERTAKFEDQGTH